jgi:SAM-dependent methyltransferase
MKLSELVQLRTHLESVYNTGSIAHEVDLANFNLLSVRNETADDNFKIQIGKVADNIKTVHAQLEHNRSLYKTLLDNVNSQIAEASAKFFSGNYDLELRVESEAVGIIRRIRTLDVDTTIREEIKARIALHSSWQYPALEIGCRDGEWTNELVASDPLYIVDYYREFIDSALSNFNPTYQTRLRTYLLKDKDYSMSMLPQGQFSFVFCWNLLNYRSLDTVKEYLKSVKELLRPGGVFMFSYNNGDIAQAAGYAENFFMSYIPKSMLMPLCESLGYNIVYSRDNNSSGTALSWIEIQKPGRLSTVKAHQVMGELTKITR